MSNYFMIHNEWLFIEIKLEMLTKTYIILMGPRRMDIFYWIDFVHIIPISYTNNLVFKRNRCHTPLYWKDCENLYINHRSASPFGTSRTDNIWMRTPLRIVSVGNFNNIWSESVKPFKSSSNNRWYPSIS